LEFGGIKLEGVYSQTACLLKTVTNVL
jgi:hypothetical protein